MNLVIDVVITEKEVPHLDKYKCIVRTLKGENVKSSEWKWSGNDVLMINEIRQISQVHIKE